MIKHFNLRVYALIINRDKEVLLSDEYFMKTYMTKFPGGGLQFGEGTLDCLRREAVEEFGQEITILDHFYTTDFFQKALFYPDHQLISIYYLAEFKQEISFRISHEAFDFEEQDRQQSFRWKSIEKLSPQDLTHPVDRKVAGMLKQHFAG